MRRKWGEKWKEVVFRDEATLNSARGGKPKTVRRPPGSQFAYDSRFLAPTFESGRFSVSFFAAITHGGHTPLIPIRKRSPNERTSGTDKLGMNKEQYTYEILEPWLVPFIYSLPGSPEDHPTIEDGLRSHTSALATACRWSYNITRMEWPPSSPDLNPIENCWAMLKERVRKKMEDPATRARTEAEYIALAQREWERLEWKKVDLMIERMPDRVKAVIKAKGGHSRY
jgi:hypothetical protein